MNNEVLTVYRLSPTRSTDLCPLISPIFCFVSTLTLIVVLTLFDWEMLVSISELGNYTVTSLIVLEIVALCCFRLLGFDINCIMIS